MILAAALLVLVALGLFVAGLLTGVTFWYWACVAVSALAAVLLLAARRQLARTDDEEPAPSRTGEAAAPPRAEEPQAEEPAAEKQEQAEPARADEEPEPAGVGPQTAERRATEDDDEPTRETAGEEPGDPPAEDVEVGDLLLVVEMHDDVFVVDEHPRYHLADCRWLADREAIPVPVDEARTDGFTPCGVCSPDRHLAQVARARKSADTA